ncbi:unnamed protein product [Rhizoctonia solani]|uniref:Uncharacterized protein n=1 Tax=Rhizoctonia solani TaxID=456999 RepID=A0A8H3BV33_9AGAM|nr:unnamed protein product [Rhizoctonia solani]
MPTGIEIAGIILAGTSLGGQVASSFGGYLRPMTKEAAQETLSGIVQQFDQLKSLRDDVSVDQYLSEREREQLDEIIVNIALDLVAVQKALRNLKKIAYWKVTTYRVEWGEFNEQTENILDRIVEVNVEIQERSISGRRKDGSDSSSSGYRGGRQFLAAHRDNFEATQDRSQQEILRAAENKAVTVIRSSIESRNTPVGLEEAADGPPASGRISADGTAHISGPDGRITVMGTTSGMRWQIPRKSASAPPSITVPECVELRELREDLD